MSERKIAPEIVDGEGRCSGEACPWWGYGNTDYPERATCFRRGAFCVPWLRHRIAELEGELDALGGEADKEHATAVRLADEVRELRAVNMAQDAQLAEADRQAEQLRTELAKAEARASKYRRRWLTEEGT